MYILIITFYTSFSGVILMLLLKMREAKTGKPTIVSRLGRGTDCFFHNIIEFVRKFFLYMNRHTFIALGHWIVFHTLLYVRKAYVNIKAAFISHPQGKKMIDAVRGRGEVRKEGASFYLRRIGEK